ncbi:MAG: type VI secretion system tube protein Hcp [Burkholderiales bacterium]|nr:type VI secretion system tube protein Hcp [Burkholderiales bacterium]
MAQTSPGASAADIFLHLQTKRAGKVKGEATAADHVDDIAVVGWHWGLSGSSVAGSTQAGARRSYTALTVIKHIDQATTALMSALATNDEVKEARLTMRRAGGSQDDYFIVKLQRGRITSVEHSTRDDGSTQETVAIHFGKVDVEYRPQAASGLRTGATTFSDELPQVG